MNGAARLKLIKYNAPRMFRISHLHNL